MRYLTITLVLATALLPTAVRAEVAFELADDGRTFVYHARPGDLPSSVAKAFGIAPDGMPAFLAANHITDATRVPPGFAYRIPNPLATRAAEAEQRATAAEQQLRPRDTRIATLEHSLADAQRAADLSAAKSDRLALLETRWRRELLFLGLALVFGAAALWIAGLALSRMREVQRHAAALEHERDVRLSTGLAERQQRERRMIELETQLADLQREPSPRARLARR